MVWLGFEPGAAGWKAQTKPRSYGVSYNRQLASITFSFVFGVVGMTVLPR